MSFTANFIAADLGASSGRVSIGRWDGRKFSIEELVRFPNSGVSMEGGLYWNVLGIWDQLCQGMMKYHARFASSPDGIGVDSWGVDFGLLDSRGRLIGNPFHYRDSRTRGISRRFLVGMSERDLFVATGTQTMDLNTLFQLYSMVENDDVHLAFADKLLMIPDLFLYFLSGEKCSEYTAATTTQMYSLANGEWATALLEYACIPVSLLTNVVSSGTVVGEVRSSVLHECGFDRTIPAVTVACHDTASAVAAIPEMDANSAFISSGTWSLIGVETGEPNLSEEAMKLQFTNEGGADGRMLLLKNISGLWILQECLRHWSLEGRHLNWADVVSAASDAKPFQSLIDPNDPLFEGQSNMPGSIWQYCQTTGQSVPETIGEIARCAFESLSLKYRSAVESLEMLTGRRLQTIRIVGGGALNTFLCQMTADACNRLTVAGPAEASTLGNVMLQAIATRHLPDIQTGRAALAESIERTWYEPRSNDEWRQAHVRFMRLESAGKRSYESTRSAIAQIR